VQVYQLLGAKKSGLKPTVNDISYYLQSSSVYSSST